jgi:hypothetical protein
MMKMFVGCGYGGVNIQGAGPVVSGGEAVCASDGDHFQNSRCAWQSKSKAQSFTS